MRTFPPKKVRTPKNFIKNIFIPSIFLMQEPRMEVVQEEENFGV